MRIAPLVLAAVLLTGCASAPPPALPDGQYTQFAAVWVNLHRCAASGYIDAATAARGRSYIQGVIQQYTYYPARIEAAIRQVEAAPWKASAESCSSAAIAIEQRRQQIDMHNQQVQAERAEQAAMQEYLNNNRPVQTYCNRTGTQTICNSY